MADNRTFRCMKYRGMAHATRDCLSCPLYGKLHKSSKWANCHGATIAPPRELQDAAKGGRR